jgi:hypothetical protein
MLYHARDIVLYVRQKIIIELIYPLIMFALFFGRIPRLSLIQHSLYVGVVEKNPPPPLIGEQYGKMDPKYPGGGHCQSVLRTQGILNVPLYC